MRNVLKFAAWLAILTLAVPFLILSLPVLLVWASIRLCGDGFRPNRAQMDEETQLMQKIHSDLVRMDQRVEALETLLLEDSYSRPDRGSYV